MANWLKGFFNYTQKGKLEWEKDGVWFKRNGFGRVLSSDNAAFRAVSASFSHIDEKTHHAVYKDEHGILGELRENDGKELTFQNVKQLEGWLETN